MATVFGQGTDSSPVSGLVRLYRDGRVPAEREAAVLEMICRRGNEQDLQVVVERLLQAPNAELQEQLLQWLHDAATTRNVQPAGDLSGVVKLVNVDQPSVQLAAIRLVATWKLKAAQPALEARVLSEDVPVAVRQQAMESLVRVAGEHGRGVLLRVLQQSPHQQAKMAAIAALVPIDLPTAAVQAAKLLATADANMQPEELLAAFLQRQGGSEALAAALSHVQLHPDVAKRTLRAVFAQGRNDPELCNLLSEAAGLQVEVPPPTAEQVAAICRDVLEQGNAQRGELIFRREDLNCLKCHSLQGAGGQVGPDLSAVGGSSPLDYIVNSVLNPNLAIKEQYVTRVFQTVDGRVLTGIVIDRDEMQVRLRDAQGQVLVLPASDIDEEYEGPSLMPTGLTKFLTYQEMLDLIRFVSELGKPGPYAPHGRHFAYRYHVFINPPEELVEDVPNLELLRQWVFSAPPNAWKSHYARFSGLLPVAEILTSRSAKAVLVRAEFRVLQAGYVELKVEYGGSYQLWFDGQPWTAFGGNTQYVEPGIHQVVLRLERDVERDLALRLELDRSAQGSAQFEWVGGP